MVMTTVSGTCFLLAPMASNFFGAVGRNNRHCLCQTCEDCGRGGYTLEEGTDPPSDSDSDTSDHSSQRPKERESTAPLNVNERRTRRGVYAVMPEKQIKEREQSTIPKIELDTEDSLLSLTFPSPSSDGALLETPQLSRESSTTSSTFLHHNSI
jgi:[histone H4]-N-methyl-L-lysine20 N-methyltransferase